MNTLESRRLLISTLSPVHIGCGKDYEPTNYVIEDDTLYAFEPDAALSVLDSQDREQLLRIVNSQASDQMLQQVQAFFYRRRQILIPTASRWMPVGAKMVAFYQKRIGQTMQAEGDSDGSQLTNQLGIGRTYFNPINRIPVLPGSSLKGSIRTALLDRINAGRSLLREDRVLAKMGKEEANQRLQKRLFEYREFEQDPMRLMQLMDASFLNREDVGSELCFAVNRSRNVTRTENNFDENLMKQRGLYQLLECVPAARFRVFDGRLTLLQSECITDSRHHLPVTNLRWNASDIAAACNHFYRSQLVKELASMSEQGYLAREWVSMIQQLLDGPVGQRLDRNEAFLLRVGRHCGAESVTLDGVRTIKILRGKGRSPDYDMEATTWWLASDDIQARTGMLPFGWLLVEPYPAESTPSDWPEIREILAGLSTEYTRWIDRKKKKIHQLAELEKRRQEEVRAHREAEITQSLLSPEQKEIAELRNWFVADRKTKQLKPLGRVIGALNRLLKEGLSWPPDDRQDLVNLAEEIFSQKSVAGDDQVQQVRKAKIQKLREGIS